MKNLKAISILLLLFLFTNNLQAQKFYTENGITTFDGSKAAFEPIKAGNDKTISIIDVGTGEIAAVIYIEKFQFRLGLMQEHFNENYLKSDIYPKSKFEGKIKNFDINELSEDFSDYEITGELIIKGVKNKIKAIAEISKSEGKIFIKSKFSIMLSDYGVKIPKIVFKKIDEEVKINLNFVYEKKI